MTDTVTTPPKTTQPKRAQPRDRQPSKAEQARDAQLAEEKLLASVPPLQGAARLGFAPRARITKLANRMRLMADKDGNLDISEDNVEQTSQFLDLMVEFAAFARTIAEVPEQWDEWERGASWGDLGQLLGIYGRAVGESSSSSD